MTVDFSYWNRAQDTALFAQSAEHFDVIVSELGTGLIAQRGPVAALGQFDAAFISHFEEQQIRDLLDVIAVVNPIVAERVAEAPEFLDDVGHWGHTG